MKTILNPYHYLSLVYHMHPASKTEKKKHADNRPEHITIRASGERCLLRAVSLTWRWMLCFLLLRRDTELETRVKQRMDRESRAGV